MTHNEAEKSLFIHAERIKWKFIRRPALRRQEHKPGMLEDETIPKPRSITQHSHHVAGQTLQQ